MRIRINEEAAEYIPSKERKMKVYKAPENHSDDYNYKVFLAGSIEMGAAEEWQTVATNAFADCKNLSILNPRRDDWDSSWKQSIDDPQFNEQVTWELDGLEESDAIIIYFDPATKSPISLMELGLHADTMQLVVVVCPEGFWRKGNVDIVCDRNGLPNVNTLDDAVALIKHNYEVSERTFNGR